MFFNFKKNKRHKQRLNDIDPDEVLIDAKNLPKFDLDSFEGWLEKPIPKYSLVSVWLVFFIVAVLFSYKVWNLEVRDGNMYAERSGQNSLRNTTIFAQRGSVVDRNGVNLIWNEQNQEQDFSSRAYINADGFAHLLGYVSYPAQDDSGVYYQNEFVGKDGIEKFFNDKLGGKNGLKITETNVVGKVISESSLEPSQNGSTLKLSIDSRVQEAMYKSISELAMKVGFTGGAGVMMDVNTGEIIAMTSFPEYNSQIMSDGNDHQAIANYLKNKNTPFINRVVGGLYTPGSIVKPFMAIAALSEGVISPTKQILSTGSISVPNPYFPGQKTVFKDWRAQGYVDMRHAIAVSSDVYFYEVGGGYADQKGLGIYNINKYAKMFGFGQNIGINFESEMAGAVPSPEWKAEKFDGERWYIGDTYHTSIGQYGFQVTPLQVVRYAASIANNGTLLRPTVILGDDVNAKKLSVPASYFQVVRDGMRLGVKEGVAKALDTNDVAIAAKTGTAELGVSKQTVNSWVMGFFPYDKPRYAFVVLMEKGPVRNLVGAPVAMRQVIDYMAKNTPEYFK